LKSEELLSLSRGTNLSTGKEEEMEFKEDYGEYNRPGKWKLEKFPI